MGEFLEKWWPSITGVVLLTLAAVLLWPEPTDSSIEAESNPVAAAPAPAPSSMETDPRSAEIDRAKSLEDARLRADLRQAESERTARTAPETDAPPAPSVDDPATGAVHFTQDSPEVRSILRQVDVELYETAWCKYCKKTRAFLDRSGVSYRAYDIEADETAKLRRVRLAPGTGVPVTVVDGQTIQGFSEQALNAAFQNAIQRRLAAR